MKLFIESRNLLRFRSHVPSPLFWKEYEFHARIFGIDCTIDHVVITFADRQKLLRYLSRLILAGFSETQGLTEWPCSASGAPRDMQMNFAAVRIGRHHLVLVASLNHGDQLHRFVEERGTVGIHHIGVLAEDFEVAMKSWARKGFFPISEPLRDGPIAQMFISNSSGQIIEFIWRDADGIHFSQRNVQHLRLSELEGMANR